MAGSVLVCLLLLMAFLLSIPAASHTGLSTWASLTASSMAFVAMALNQFLATRPKIIEGMFGGLDRMYCIHKTLGKIALVMILVHYFVTPSFKGQILTSGLNDLAKDAATIGFWSLLVLIAFSLVKKVPFTKYEVPYHIWRQSHRFIGIAFLFIAFHQMFIKRPFDGNVLLAGYLNIFAVIGAASFLFTQLAPFWRMRKYEVTSVEKKGGATLISAVPTSRPIESTAGQFAVMNSEKSGLREPHPFTIAGRDEIGGLSFAIKASGDFTKCLYERIEVGDQLQIQGGYGRFNFRSKDSRQLWLAGGIGITPFLALAQNLDSSLSQQICLIHCVGDVAEAVDREALTKKAEQVGNFSYVLVSSAESGRLDAQKLAEMVGFEIDGATMMFCGPPALRVAITKGLKDIGKKFSSVKFELFEFR